MQEKIFATQFSSFSLKHQEECFTAILGSLQKDFQRTAFAYRKITEEKGKTGRRGGKREEKTDEPAAGEHRVHLCEQQIWPLVKKS